MAKLHKFFVSKNWDFKYLNGHSCLSSDVSDHVPILLTSVFDKNDIRRFKFERIWLMEDSFKGLVNGWWEKPTFQFDSVANLVFKLRKVRIECKSWYKQNFIVSGRRWIS